MKTLRTISILIVFSLLVGTSIAQESSQKRNVSDFTGISTQESIKVELSQGDKESVEVIADEEYIDRVETEVKGDVLHISIKGNSWNNWNKGILVKVTAKKINTLIASSSSSIITQNLIETDKLKIHTSSSAKVKVAFKADEAICRASSSSKASLKGEARYFDADVSSSASIAAEGLRVSKIAANASSSGKITVNALDELVARASSSGSVKYVSKPKMLDASASSSGKVRQID